jgi:hypothetical protein
MTAHYRVPGRGAWRAQPGERAADVVLADDEGAQRRVPDDRQRGRIDHDALEQVEVQAERVGEDGLDHIAVAARQPERVRPMLGGDPGVPLAYRRHRPVRHRGHRLPARKDGRTGVRLHHLPQRPLRQRLERLPRPVAVVTLDQPWFLADRGIRQRGGHRLPAPQQRAAHHSGQRQPGGAQPLADRRRLRPTGLVELGGLVAGEGTGVVGRGPAVPEQDDGGHAINLPAGALADAHVAASQPAPSATMRITPSATR